MNVNFKSSVGQGKSLFFGKSNDGKKTLFKKAPPPPTWDIGIRTTSSNQTFSIRLNGENPNITVDWGDGTVENFNTIGDKIRTYAFAGNYTVKIRGSFSANGNIRLGTTLAERIRVKSTSVIPTIPGLSNFDNSFISCGFTSIPAGLFDNNPAVTGFNGCFLNCSLLTSIPSDLFAKNTVVTGFVGCFTQCSSLTSIPTGLFDNNTAVTDFGVCFLNCSSLTSIPAGLFNNNTAVTNFSQSFENCASLTSIPAGLFNNNTAVTNFNRCFFGVTLTTESYSNLLINMASNSASRQNNVLFDGGNSKYNTAGQTARQTLQAKGWTFTDNGFDTSSEEILENNILVTNAGVNSINGEYDFVGIVNNKPSYSSVGHAILWEGNNFKIQKLMIFGFETIYSSDQNVLHPWQVTNWTASNPAYNPTPTVTQVV